MVVSRIEYNSSPIVESWNQESQVLKWIINININESESNSNDRIENWIIMKEAKGKEKKPNSEGQKFQLSGLMHEQKFLMS
jgi:hypothetical protein